MFRIIGRQGVDLPGKDLLPSADVGLMLIAFVLLLYFGVSFLAEDLRRPRLLWIMPVCVFAWVALTLILSQQYRAGLTDWTSHASICGRYVLYFPGALLAAAALVRQGRFYDASGLSGVGVCCRRAGAAFVVSAVLSGLVVPGADFFPASVLNYATFAGTFGLPVAVFRALLALIIAYFLLSAVRRLDSERRRQLEFANDQLQRLAVQALSAQETERSRIARELHDETVQLLSLLLMRLKLLKNEADEEVRQRRLEDSSHLALQAADGLRRIAHDLRPPAIDDLGLVPALEWYVDYFRGQYNLEVDFQADHPIDRPTREVELALYRVAQEALTNVAKHAAARRVWVRVRRTREALIALVEDDGRGFNVAAVRGSRDTGLGLFGMEERASLVGGDLSIESRPGRGTCIRVKVPLGGSAYA
jgi:signal transduction histidine kinase